jgi:hypothetical protein
MLLPPYRRRHAATAVPPPPAAATMLLPPPPSRCPQAAATAIQYRPRCRRRHAAAATAVLLLPCCCCCRCHTAAAALLLPPLPRCRHCHATGRKEGWRQQLVWRVTKRARATRAMPMAWQQTWQWQPMATTHGRCSTAATIGLAHRTRPLVLQLERGG